MKILFVAAVLTVFLSIFSYLSKHSQNSSSSTTKQNSAATGTSNFILKAGDSTRIVPGWPGRPYDIHLPTGYDKSQPVPVIIAIHGGGGSSQKMAKLTCPDGNLQNAGCLNKLADREGFAVVYPNGTPNPLLANLRTWNAGGGKQGYSCLSGVACKNNVDDVGYFKALLDDLQSVVNVDSKRVYATGISNGAAMSHRLACELSDRIAAIAPIAGGNQFSTISTCSPSRPVPVVEIHGSTDPGWPYLGGENKTSLWNFIGSTPGNFISIPATVSGWVARNGCGNPTTTNLSSKVNDGTTVTKTVYAGCKNNADVVLYKIANGGHTWPDGWQYLAEKYVGITTRNLNANEVIWDFFKAHPMK